ncbi:DUF1266 domain-containing protein [Risungbinella massiliensis]|uniref:DUF1266 domain-containing protein n=1 Tax=Risungbinella massiliensis TaxID=1329796 RepID=UPI0005CC057C|nr:DUF1266 domain-containing protein [Risungbinella massiliensis]
MTKRYSRKQRKTLESYFRCLSAACIESNTLPYYFTNHEFSLIRDRWIGKRLFSLALSKWGISNGPELKQQIDWFLHQGVRQEFKEYRNQMTALTETARTQYIESSKEEAHYGKLYQVNSGIQSLPPAGIFAFDLAWVIHLCRIGRSLRYLSKGEAWDRMIQASQLAQQSYSTWSEYLNAFLVGRLFHESEVNFNSSGGKNVASYISILLYSPKSPLLKLEWNHPLFKGIDEKRVG